MAAVSFHAVASILQDRVTDMSETTCGFQAGVLPRRCQAQRPCWAHTVTASGMFAVPR